jgi:hypothetical protein
MQKTAAESPNLQPPQFNDAERINGRGERIRISLAGFLLITPHHKQFLFNEVWRGKSLLVIPYFAKSRKV